MNLWRLEWIRLTRTRRWVALVGVYLLFGFLGPLTARYMAEIIESVGGGLEVIAPQPVAADGLATYVSNVSQIGLMVSVGVAAAAFVFDANPQMGIFLRTRVTNMRHIVGPRYVVMTAAVMASFAIGSVAALYESIVLMGSLPIDAWAWGTVLECLYLAFAMALVAAIAGKLRSVIVVAIVAIGILLIFPLVGLIPGVSEWLPSHLVGALEALALGASLGDYLGSVVVTVVLTAGLLWLAVRWSAHRPL
jgi:ABC-2 type transport system permease protein